MPPGILDMLESEDARRPAAASRMWTSTWFASLLAALILLTSLAATAALTKPSALLPGAGDLSFVSSHDAIFDAVRVESETRVKASPRRLPPGPPEADFDIALPAVAGPDRPAFLYAADGAALRLAHFDLVGTVRARAPPLPIS